MDYIHEKFNDYHAKLISFNHCIKTSETIVIKKILSLKKRENDKNKNSLK
jgi:hypothetical protein